MASSLLPPVLKCGQCRHTLQNVRPPQPSSEASSQPDVIPVVEDDSAELPKWIQDKIEEVKSAIIPRDDDRLTCHGCMHLSSLNCMRMQLSPTATVQVCNSTFFS